MSEITQLLRVAEQEGPQAMEKLLPLVYDELRHLAARRLRRESEPVTLQATALVHEAWLKLAQGGGREWNDRQHFLRAAALAMRRILVDEVRKKTTIKRGQRGQRVELSDLNLSNPEPDERVLLVNEALIRLEAEDPESARLVTYRFFGGFSNEETAELLGVSERTLNRQWAYAKASLYRIIRASIGAAPEDANGRDASCPASRGAAGETGSAGEKGSAP